MPKKKILVSEKDAEIFFNELHSDKEPNKALRDASKKRKLKK